MSVWNVVQSPDGSVRRKTATDEWFLSEVR